LSEFPVGLQSESRAEGIDVIGDIAKRGIALRRSDVVDANVGSGGYVDGGDPPAERARTVNRHGTMVEIRWDIERHRPSPRETQAVSR
jgi:hypothetical protein